jgi:hypothetical protein
MTKEKIFTDSIKCGHFQNYAPMPIVSHYSNLRDYEEGEGILDWEAGSIYEIIECPACGEISLRKYLWHSMLSDGEEIEYKYLYPLDQTDLQGLPSNIKSGYQAAQRVRNIDTNAYAVLLGRVLDLICADRNATGDTLDKRLKSLSERGEIPEKLVDVSSGLRKLRNIGANADLGELSSADLPVLDGLTRAILEYVYSAPLLIEETEKRLDKLKKKKAKNTLKNDTTDHLKE